MKNIYENICKNKILYLINAVALFGTYMITMNFQITSDVLYSEMIGEIAKAPSLSEHLASGRYTNYLISWFYRFLNLFGINKMHHQWVLQFMGILVYAIAACVLYRMFEKALKLDKYSVILNVLILICFINPFIAETYVYVAFDWAVGILLAVLSAKYIIDRKYVRGWIVAFLAVSTYQCNIIMTLLFCVTIAFIENHLKFLELIKRVLISGIMTLSAAVVNILIPKICLVLHITDEIVKQTGVKDEWSLRLQWISDIIRLCIIKAYGMLPNYFIPIIVVVVFFAVSFVLLIKNGWKKIWSILMWGLVAAGCMMVPFAPCFVSTTIGFPQRTLTPVFMGFSMILICGYAFLKDTKYLSKAFVVGTVWVAGIMLYSTQTGLQDCYIANAIDFYEAQEIEEAIDDYETQSGNEITDIVVHRMGSIHYAYKEQHYENVYTLYAHRLYYDAWADVNLLNYMFGKNYHRINMDEQYTDNTEYYQSLIQQYWEGKSWSHLDTDEQLVFDGNTMYWALY